MKRGLFAFAFFLLIGCHTAYDDKNIMVFLAIDKLSDRDGLYFNLAQPDGLPLYHQGHCNNFARPEPTCYFNEVDKGQRKMMRYNKAYRIFQKRYEKSYLELYPTDFSSGHPDIVYDALIIDTLRKTAFATGILRTSVLF